MEEPLLDGDLNDAGREDDDDLDWKANQRVQRTRPSFEREKPN